MGIAGLSDWLKQLMPGNQPISNPILENPQPRKQPTIQPGVPVPSFRPEAGGGYSVQGLQPGQSTFAPWGPGMGVLKNPQRGLPRFDPTGQYNDNNLPQNPNAFLMMPMAPLEYQPMPYMQPIGVDR